jgi:cytochrome c553
MRRARAPAATRAGFIYVNRFWFNASMVFDRHSQLDSRGMFRFILVVVFSLLSAGFAQESSSSAGLISNPTFQKNCAKCHGKTAEGRHFGGPSLVSESTRSKSAEDLKNIISNGKGRMPKYAGKLTPEEVETLVGQIKNFK